MPAILFLDIDSRYFTSCLNKDMCMDDQWCTRCNYEKMRTILKFLKRTNYATSAMDEKETGEDQLVCLFLMYPWKGEIHCLWGRGNYQNSRHNKIFYKKKKRQTHSYKCICICVPI